MVANRCRPDANNTFFSTGLVNAHTGEPVRSWNSIQFYKINAVVGNAKTGKEYVDLSVDKISATRCRHYDVVRRIEVSASMHFILP